MAPPEVAFGGQIGGEESGGAEHKEEGFAHESSISMKVPWERRILRGTCYVELMLRALCAVALAAAVILLVRAERIGLAGDYVDPVTHITAQDEALYSSSAIWMAVRGDPMTPRFMGRLALYKPPMLIWSAALSAKLLGVSRLSLRLPIVVVAALAAGLLFLWAAEVQNRWAGAAAALLLISNHLWMTLGALCMTDALLSACFVGAFYALFSDPWLESRAGLFGFSGAVAAAILTKGIAGLLPLAVLALYWMAAPRNYRASLLRVAMAGALILVLAAPWYAYQSLVHPRWFWTEHVMVEILGFGAGTPPQTSHEPQVLFYLTRLAAIDPVLLAAAAAGVPVLLSQLRKREAGATLLACWMLAAGASVLLWQYRSASYLLPLVPALALLASAYSPFGDRRYAPWMVACLAGVFLVKCAVPELSWGLSFRAGTIQPLAQPLSAYCAQKRGNQLIIVNVADDLYGATLPLEHLRYAALGFAGPDLRYGLPFEEMGITVTARQFNHLAEYEPRFRDRLRQWGVDSSDPIATLIFLKDADELASLTVAHPEIDFLVPQRHHYALGQAPQEVAPAGLDYFFLMSRQRIERSAPPAWGCHL
jgi:hypothetical protein